MPTDKFIGDYPKRKKICEKKKYNIKNIFAYNGKNNSIKSLIGK